MPKIPLVLLIAAGVVQTPLLAETTPANLPGAEVDVYKTASGDDLRLYRFDPPDHDPKTESRPAIVFFFGGGWNGGSVTQFEPHARYLAQRGMVAFVADYRVKSRQGTSPRACVADGKSAVRWIRENAERLGVDPNRIAAGGGSAGGHVAAAAGICEGFDEPEESAEISSKPDALVLFNPVYDNGPDGYGHSRIEEWFPAISPAHNISEDDPPTIVFLGTKDKLIAVETAEKFRDKQEAVGVRSELHLYEGEPHGFFNLRGKKAGSANFVDTVLKTDAFLAEIGFLEGEPDRKALAAIANGDKT